MSEHVGIFFVWSHLKTVQAKIKRFLRKVCQDRTNENLVFVVVSTDLMQKLEYQSDRIAFINSDQFTSGIVYSLCTRCDFKSKTINLGDCAAQFISTFVNAVGLYFEAEYKIFTVYKEGIEHSGFGNPFVCAESPSRMCLYKSNDYFKPNPSEVKRDLNYVLSQMANKHCNLSLKIEHDTFQFLQRLTMVGVKDGTQREIFGSLILVSSETTTTGVIYTIALDKTKELVHGENEAVSGVPTLYTFHSHPYSAYVANKSKYGYPSISDYLAMYTMHQMGMVLHFVAAIEGLYVIHVDPDSPLLNKSEKEIVKHIKRVTKVDRHAIVDIRDYVNYINEESGLFDLQLLEWTEFEPVINVSFMKTGDNCSIR